MLTAKSIRDKCNKDILELQNNCNHPSSKWMNEEFAPAHGTGCTVKVCDICEKVLERKGGFNYNVITNN